MSFLRTQNSELSSNLTKQHCLTPSTCQINTVQHNKQRFTRVQQVTVSNLLFPLSVVSFSLFQINLDTQQAYPFDMSEVQKSIAPPGQNILSFTDSPHPEERGKEKCKHDPGALNCFHTMQQQQPKGLNSVHSDSIQYSRINDKESMHIAVQHMIKNTGCFMQRTIIYADDTTMHERAHAKRMARCALINAPNSEELTHMMARTCTYQLTHMTDHTWTGCTCVKCSALLGSERRGRDGSLT